jgi:hypothetical protein
MAAADDPETLLGYETSHGGYGAIETKWTLINDNWEIMVGGKGGWIINHQLVIGVAGYGVATNLYDEQDHILYDYYHDYRPYEMGYGGLLIEYIFEPKKVSHITLSALIGGGSVVRNDAYWYDPLDPNYYPYRYYNETDEFLVFEPGINFMLNISKHVRAGLGLSYRLTEDVDSGGFYDRDEFDLDGPSFNVLMKFGKF